MNNIGIEVRHIIPGTNEDELVKMSKLDQYKKPMEIWTAVGTNKQLSYSTHGLFRYFGKFPAPIATKLITDYTKPNDVVYDLMCGSGTTGVEALLNDREAVLNDINPLSILLSKVKTTKLKSRDIKSYLANFSQKYTPLSYDEYPFKPLLKDEKHWFLEETLDSLRGIRKLIDLEEDPDFKDYLTICFLSIVRRVSKATTQQGRLFLDIETAEKDALPFFIKKVESSWESVTNLPSDHTATIISRDLRMDGLEQIKSDLVILHPPYFNSYKYSSINSLELSWMNVDRKSFNKSEIREFFKIGKAENSTKYIQDMVETLKNVGNCMKSNSILALMIGDTTCHGEYVPITKTLLDASLELYNIEKIILRVPKYTEASWASSQRRIGDAVGVKICDFIIILRKI